MSSTFERTLRRFDIMRATDRAIAQAHFDLARSLTDPARVIFFARRGQAMQTCDATTCIHVRRHDDDAPWVELRTSKHCGLRTCQKCQRRRAKRLHRLHQRILSTVWKTVPDARISLLTLTSKNRPLAEARAMLVDHMAAVKRYYALCEVKRSHLGVLSGIEAAIRGTDAEPQIGIHSHHGQFITDDCMVSGRYLSIVRIRELFQQALRVDYLPLAWIKATEPDVDGDIYAPSRATCLETTKYCTKSQSYLRKLPPRDLFGSRPDFYVDPRVILHLTDALHNRQLTSMTGLWAKARAELSRAARAAAAAKPSSSVTDPWAFAPAGDEGVPF